MQSKDPMRYILKFSLYCGRLGHPIRECRTRARDRLRNGSKSTPETIRFNTIHKRNKKQVDSVVDGLIIIRPVFTTDKIKTAKDATIPHHGNGPMLVRINRTWIEKHLIGQDKQNKTAKYHNDGSREITKTRKAVLTFHLRNKRERIHLHANVTKIKMAKGTTATSRCPCVQRKSENLSKSRDVNRSHEKLSYSWTKFIQSASYSTSQVT